eukprot:TRINITY_DN13722_c0_g1_i1.p1 TRINITY_DN13722_c0_g1~~TRINITY_DN13722_c0_g1_i1.p1  ORF type:complete len:434 (+),score=172.43 TRINITY_DN13722_c0_g1_i1:85-1302(+)
MPGGGDAVSLVLLVVGLPILCSVMPWWEFAGETALGVDLGTTFSVASVCQGGKMEAVVVDRDVPLVPSAVSFVKGFGKKDVAVGWRALDDQLEAPDEVVALAKRYIGRKYDDGIVGEEAAEVHYAVVEGAKGFAAAEIKERLVAPEEVGGHILRTLKAAAEASVGYWKSLLGFKFYTATVTVPVSFDGFQRAATHAAGKAAGFSMIRLIEEPVAAAMAYNLHDGEECDVIVYDMGGGTLDVALLRLQRDSNTFLIVDTAGDPKLGGSDFDRCVLHHIEARLNVAAAELSKKQRALLLRTAEQAKIALSDSDSTPVRTPWGDLTLTLDDLSRECKVLVDRALDPVLELLDVSLVPEEQLQVVLAGGSSRLRPVRNKLIERFGEERVHFDLDPDLAISLGASKAYGC